MASKIPIIGGIGAAFAGIVFILFFTPYALVDVAAVGFGKKSKLIKNHANIGDFVVLIDKMISEIENS